MKKLTIVITRCKEDLATLSRLLDSITHQTFKDLEVILSDDGTKASSIEPIRDKYAFPIFNVRSDKKTVSHARNIGFKAASSKYVMFCDCDDMFYDSNPTGLEDAIKKMDENGIQVLRSVIMFEHPTKAKTKMLSALAQLDVEDELELVKSNSINGSSVHGKIFNLEFVKHVGAEFCDDLSINEEAPFVNFAHQVAEQTHDVQQPFYIWKYNADSVTRNIGKLYPIKGLDQYLKATSIWQKKVIAYDKLYGTSKFKYRLVAGTLMQAHYWLEDMHNKYCDIKDYEHYYKLDIDEAVKFYVEFKMYITEDSIRSWLKVYSTQYGIEADGDYVDGVFLWLEYLETMHDLKNKS